MQKLSFLLLFIPAFLYAESDDVTSKLVLNSKSFELAHKSAYGVTNNYSFLVAEHQIHADRCLVFHYGTKLGFVIEDYTAENGFGPDAEKYGAIIEANMGFDYAIKKYQKLSFEGSHTQNELQNQTESLLKIGYQYKF